MKTPYFAHAIEWWLKTQGKFDGARVRTSEGKIINVVDNTTIITGDGNFKIDEWIVDGVQEPTINEILVILQEYNIFKEEENRKKLESTISAKEKLKALGFTEDEITAIKESL